MVVKYMKENAVKDILVQVLSFKEIHVVVYNDHYQIIAVDSIFSNMNIVEAHKVIYAPLAKYILNNQIHSVSIKVFTPKEWQEKRRLFNI